MFPGADTQYCCTVRSQPERCIHLVAIMSVLAPIIVIWRTGALPRSLVALGALEIIVNVLERRIVLTIWLQCWRLCRWLRPLRGGCLGCGREHLDADEDADLPKRKKPSRHDPAPLLGADPRRRETTALSRCRSSTQTTIAVSLYSNVNGSSVVHIAAPSLADRCTSPAKRKIRRSPPTGA